MSWRIHVCADPQRKRKGTKRVTIITKTNNDIVAPPTNSRNGLPLSSPETDKVACLQRKDDQERGGAGVMSRVIVDSRRRRRRRRRRGGKETGLSQVLLPVLLLLLLRPPPLEPNSASPANKYI